MPEVDTEQSEEPYSISVDLDAYRSIFEDPDISDKDKDALLTALWSVVMSMVQIGWGVHPVQQAQAARGRRDLPCGKVAALNPDGEADADGVVELSDQILIGVFEGAADMPQIAGNP